MMDELLAWLQRSEGPLGYVVLGLASLIEYVFPPFPGDTVTLFGVFLAATAGYGVVWVYLSLLLGAVAGGMTAYAFGRWLGKRRAEHAPRFLRSQQVRHAIDLTLARFERHGSIYLALNRFLPALRAVFFVAAGMARLDPWKVALWGGVSAAVWNALLLGLGWVVGDNFERLREWVSTYSHVAIVLAASAVVAALLWRFSGRRSRRRSGHGSSGAVEPREAEDGRSRDPG